MPNEIQLDALREVANVGCGHAATALSRLVGGRRVQMELPRAWVRPAGQLAELMGNPSADVTVAAFAMEGDLQGRLLLVLGDEDARQLSSALVNVPHPGEHVEPHRSALAEAANIVASACLNAIGGLTGQRLVPSIPTLFHARASALPADLWGPPGGQLKLALEARFVAQLDRPMPGRIFVIPDAPSVKALLARLGV